jgi:hypothetical protein
MAILTAQFVPEIQALTKTIHPITTAEKPNKEKNNSNNIPESQALMETIHPITTVKKLKKEKSNSNNKSLLLQELLETAKKGKLQAQKTRMPLVTPKAVGQIRRRRQPMQLTLLLLADWPQRHPRKCPCSRLVVDVSSTVLPLALGHDTRDFPSLWMDDFMDTTDERLAGDCNRMRCILSAR